MEASNTVTNPADQLLESDILFWFGIQGFY